MVDLARSDGHFPVADEGHRHLLPEDFDAGRLKAQVRRVVVRDVDVGEPNDAVGLAHSIDGLVERDLVEYSAAGDERPCLVDVEPVVTGRGRPAQLVDLYGDLLVVLSERRVLVERKKLKVAEDHDAGFVVQERAQTQHVLVVAEHESFRGVPVECVVGDRRLQQGVEPRDEVQSTVRLHPGECGLDGVVVVLDVPSAGLQAHGDALDQVPQLPEDVLG